MFRLIINLIILNSITVQSCPSSSSPNKPLLELEPFCPEYEYKEHEERTDILSKLPDPRQIGLVSLTGTHQSMTYSSTDLKLRTQELSLTEQLLYGVRVFDITVTLEYHIFTIYSGGQSLNRKLSYVLKRMNAFLHINPGEFVVIKMSYDYSTNITDTLSADIESAINYLHDNIIGGQRVVTDWTLHDTLEELRGKILLMTSDIAFKNSISWIKHGCVLFYDQSDDVESNVNYKWDKYLSVIHNDLVEDVKCIYYDFSVYDDDYYSRGAAKYGGYYDPNKSNCTLPLNYRIDHYYLGNRYLKMNIYVFNYVTQELIDTIDKFNHDKVSLFS